MSNHVLACSQSRRQLRNPASVALHIAARIEPDAYLRDQWFHNDPIAELRGMTAARAIALGYTRDLVRMLRSIAAGVRG
jgi:hypothetical protein